MVKNYLVAAAMAACAAALPSDNLAGRAYCAEDNCYRAILHSTARLASCTSYMAVTVTPCTSTVTATAVVTETATVNNFPMKRAAVPALEARQDDASSCVYSTSTPTSLPVFATTACTALATALPAARLSSACSCNGVTASTVTLPSPVTTVTSTSTVSATAYATPSAFVLQSTGDQSLYVSVDSTGALVLTHDFSAGEPFYVDNAGQLRSLHDPTKLIVDYYQPSPATADNRVYAAVPDATANYRITCNNVGRQEGQYWGNCQASGPPNGNPVVYGFGTCPNEGFFVYMIPNNSNVRCWDGGYAFAGFYLRAYTGA